MNSGGDSFGRAGETERRTAEWNKKKDEAIAAARRRKNEMRGTGRRAVGMSRNDHNRLKTVTQWPGRRCKKNTAGLLSKHYDQIGNDPVEKSDRLAWAAVAAKASRGAESTRRRRRATLRGSRELTDL